MRTTFEVAGLSNVSTNNSTLSSLPTHLQRYTGEQNFYLVEANVSVVRTGCNGCPVNSDPIPFPWGGFYSMTLTQDMNHGLVNFLVPRGQFLASPMGQAVLEDQAPQSPSLTPAIIGPAEPSWDMTSLYCRLQNISVMKSPDLRPSSWGFQGTYPGTRGFLTVYADTESCSTEPIPSANCQAEGVPSNPYLESGYPSPALQGVLTLNVTSTYDLDLLLAGLLDNSTGGVNGTLRDVTYQQPTLGLDHVVMAALANAPQPSDGVFGPPVSTATPPPAPCDWGCSLWNTVSGIATTIVSSVLYVAGVVWNAAVAAATYVDEIAQGLASLAEKAVSAAVTALKTVAKALEAALQALVAAIVRAVEQLLLPIWNMVTSGILSYFSGVSSAFGTLSTALATAVTQPSSGATSQALSAGTGLGLSLLDAQGVASTLSSAFQWISTAIQPILSLINIEALMNKVMGFLEQGPLGGIVNAIGGLIGAGESSVVSGIRSLLGSAGLEAAVPSTLLTPSISALLGDSNQLGQFIGSYLSPVISGFFAEFLNQISSPYGYIDFVSTIVAAESFGAALVFEKLGTGLRAGVNILGIALTAIGLGLFGVGGFCDDVWSMFVDLASFWTDLEDIFVLTGVKTPVGLIADGIDAFADWYDIWLSAKDAMSLTPQSCVPL